MPKGNNGNNNGGGNGGGGNGGTNAGGGGNGGNANHNANNQNNNAGNNNHPNGGGNGGNGGGGNNGGNNGAGNGNGNNNPNNNNNHNNGGGNNNHNGNGGAGASEGGTGPLHAAIGGGNVAGGGGNGHHGNGNHGGNGQGGGLGDDFTDDFGPDEEGAIGLDDPETEDFGPNNLGGDEASDQDLSDTGADTGGGVGATDGGGATPAPNYSGTNNDFVSDDGTQNDGGIDLSSSDGGDFDGGFDSSADGGFSDEMGSGGTAPTYIVAPGDTLSGIAQQNGISLADLEAMNPQIKNPDLIFPGQTVTIGAPPVEEGAGVSDGEFMGDELTGMEGGGVVADPESETDVFPTSSSYPPSDNAQMQKALGNKFKSLGNRLKGWGIGSPPSDPARNAMYVSSQRNTDPLNIKDNKGNRGPEN